MNAADFDLDLGDGWRVRVRFVSPRAMGRMVTGHPYEGDYKDRLIRISTGIPRDQQRTTFAHELLHACLERSGFKIKRREEELVFSAVDTWLVQALRGSPQARRMLYG